MAIKFWLLFRVYLSGTPILSTAPLFCRGDKLKGSSSNWCRMYYSYVSFTIVALHAPFQVVNNFRMYFCVLGDINCEETTKFCIIN